jgi:ATP-binding cassette subfamily C protein CydC
VSPVRPVGPARKTPYRALTSAGVALAILAEACTLGLLGLSGWFIASCAMASASFSYAAPSGGVRSFAVGRIGANYLQRLTLHSAALRKLTAIRVAFFLAVADARPGTVRRLRSGEVLDRAMRDAETLSESTIRGAAPLMVFGAMTAGATAGIAWITPAAAVPLLLGALLCIFVGSRDNTSVTEDERGAVRGELVTAIDSWPEMMSLGAIDPIRARVHSILARTTAQERREQVRTDDLALRIGLISALALSATIGVAAWSQVPVPLMVLVSLAAISVLELTGTLASAIRAIRHARSAERRLRALERDAPTIVQDAPAAGAQARPVFTIGSGETILVCGRSGSGKTTMLSAIADQLDAAHPGATAARGRDGAPPTVTFVAHDDYLFTGTVASNCRLANPAVTTESIECLLADFGLAPAGIGPGTAIGVGGRGLSGGEQRRLHLLRATIAAPDILIIDEPTLGMDRETAALSLAAIRAHLPACSLVLGLHQPLPVPGSAAPRVIWLDRRMWPRGREAGASERNSS